MHNKLLAFADQPGELKHLWTYETGERIPGSPAIGPDGNIRIHSGDGHLHIVTAEGQRFGNLAKVGEALGWASPLVDAQNVTWICGYYGGLLKVDERGQVVGAPFFRGKQRFDCTGLIHQGVLYVGAENACVYAIELGETRGKNLWDHLAERGRTGWFINSAIALGPGPVLVVASRNDQLYGFQLDGQRLWSVPMEGLMLGSPVVDVDGSVYVGLSIVHERKRPRGALVRIDGGSHKMRWLYETEAAIESTPVIGDDGTIYFGDNDGVIHAVNTDRKVLWTEKVAAPVRSPGALVGSGRVVFGLENGQYVALRCDSPKLRIGAWAKHLGNASQTGIANI